MKYKITLELNSPMLIGGKKLNNDYIKSQEFVPGSVLRAALSHEITERCDYYSDENNEKKHWVKYLDKDNCKTCSVKNLCKNFSEIKIGHCYPLNARSYPLTAMKCKNHPTHEAFDTLIEKIKRKIALSDKSYKAESKAFVCPHPNCGERTERYDGLYVSHDNKIEDIKLVYHLVTKNAINPYLKVANDGALYTLDTISDIVLLGNEELKLSFEGIIEGEGLESDLKAIDTLHIGAYNTAGFGEVSLYSQIMKENDNVEQIERKICEFNVDINYGNKYYIPFTLKTDAYLGIEASKEGKLYSISTEEYIKIYEDILHQFIPSYMKLYNIIASNDMRAGFDTSNMKARFRKNKIVTKVGSIFVFEVDKNLIDYNELFKIQQRGLGENREHGFGQVAIAEDFHIKWRVKNGGNENES